VKGHIKSIQLIKQDPCLIGQMDFRVFKIIISVSKLFTISSIGRFLVSGTKRIINKVINIKMNPYIKNEYDLIAPSIKGNVTVMMQLADQLANEAIVFAFPRLSEEKSSVTKIHEIGPKLTE